MKILGAEYYAKKPLQKISGLYHTQKFLTGSKEGTVVNQACIG